MHRIVTWTARRLVLAGCCLLTSCGDGNSPVGILIELKNLPPRVERLQVSGTLDGQPAISDVSDLATSGLSRFGITVPATARGSLDIRLKLFDADGCTQGSASLRTPLPIARGTSLTASIAQQAPRQCEPLLSCADRTLCPQTKLQSSRLWSVWAIANNDIWAVGDAATALHFDGLTWTPVNTGIPAGINLSSVWASASDEVWATGGNSAGTIGYILRYDGSRWWTSFEGSRHMSAIHGASRTEIFAVGYSNAATTQPGEIRRWDSRITNWLSITGSVNQNYLGVWTRSANEAWIVGQSGTVLRYNGTATTAIPIGVTGDLYAAHGYVAETGQSIVYAVGPGGLIVRHDGSLRRVQPALTTHLYGVLATKEAIYVAGAGGILYRSPGLSDTFTAFGGGSDALRSLSLAPNGIAWVVGDSGFQGYIDTRP